MADVSALTALRYRAQFNRSVMTTDFTDNDALDLLYAAVGNVAERSSTIFSYEKFCACRLSKKYAADMYISAGAVLREIMKDSGVKREVIEKADESIQKDDGGTIYDEFCIVSVMTNIGLPFELLREVSLIQLMYIIAQAYEMKYGKRDKVEVMSDGEMLDALNITDDRLLQIEEYLSRTEFGELHPEEMPEDENC